MRDEVLTPPPDAEVSGEMSDADLDAVSAGGQKGQVVARSLPSQWGGRSTRAATVRPAAAAVAAVRAAFGGCAGGVCPVR